MDGLVVGSHASFLEGLTKSRVGVRNSSDILRGGTVLNSQNSLSDHLAGSGPNDVGSEDLVSVLLGQNLDQSIGIGVGLGS